MTPFAPRIPKIAADAASFKIFKDSISFGSILEKSSACRSIPSIINVGAVLPLKVATPRMKRDELSIPGSPVACLAIKPGSCPIMAFEVLADCDFKISLLLIDATAPVKFTFFCTP